MIESAAGFPTGVENSLHLAASLGPLPAIQLVPNRGVPEGSCGRLGWIVPTIKSQMEPVGRFRARGCCNPEEHNGPSGDGRPNSSPPTMREAAQERGTREVGEHLSFVGLLHAIFLALDARVRKKEKCQFAIRRLRQVAQVLRAVQRLL